MAGDVSARHVRPVLPVRRMDGSAVRRLYASTGGPDIRGSGHADAHAAGLDRRDRAPDENERVCRGGHARGGYAAADPGYPCPRPHVRRHRWRPVAHRPRPGPPQGLAAGTDLAAVRGAVARFRRHVAQQARLARLRGRHPGRRLGNGAWLLRGDGCRDPPDVVLAPGRCRMSRLVRAAVAVAILHITPTVILVKRPEAVTRLAPGADAFFAREAHLSGADAHRLNRAVDWSPEDGVLTFYIGKHGAATVGAFLFIRVDTPHGPLEVAVGFDPAGAIRAVEVTKATVETKPWVLEALRAGL